MPARRIVRWLIGLALLGVLSGCGLQDIPHAQDTAERAWSRLQAVYQQRSARVPEVLAAADVAATPDEREARASLVDARDRLDAIHVGPEMLHHPHRMRQYIAAQDRLGAALAQLFTIFDRLPSPSGSTSRSLSADFQSLQDEIVAARDAYATAAQRYNTELATWPGRFWHWLLYDDRQPLADLGPGADTSGTSAGMAF